MKQLKQEIQTGKLTNIHLWCGNEEFLKQHYETVLKETLLPPGTELMNLDIFDGKTAAPESIIEAGKTPPFMCENRLIFVRNSELLVSGRKDATEELESALRDWPPFTILVLIESQVDKRLKIYKTVQKYGLVTEMNTPHEKDFMKWVINRCQKYHVTIAPATAQLLIHMVSGDMNTVAMEIDKLANYKQQGEITQEDIHALVHPSLESKIFDLVDAVASKDKKNALSIYNGLIQMKESPLMVLFMLERQFRLILQTKVYLAQNLSLDETAEKMDVKRFIASKCAAQAKKITVPVLEKALTECLKLDIAIKTGQVNDILGVELFIAHYTDIA